MLPRAHRLRDAESFRAVVRRGRRAGSRTLVVHLVEPAEPTAAAAVASEQVRVGLIVGKDVGSAVTRNRVKRRLRHLLADLLEDSVGAPAAALAPGTLLVVRALPAAAKEGSPLAEDLTRCLRSARERVPA